MHARSRTPEAFLVSLGAILLEVSYTRVFSFKLVYYFTYLIIGIALLGLGAGGILLAIAPRLRRAAPERLIPIACAIAAASVLVGYLVIALVRLDAFDLVHAVLQRRLETVLAEGFDLFLLCTALFVPFLAAGIALATIFASQPEEIPRLYGADLIGAALGCAAAVPLVATITPPGAIALGGLCFAVAALPLAAAQLRGAIAPIAAVGAALAISAAFPQLLPDPVPDRVKSLGQGTSQVLFSRWSPVFRVDVATSLRPDAHFLVHDGTIGSFLERWNPGEGDPAARYAGSDRALPFRVLPAGPRVAIIGSAGGSEVRASLALGASGVVAVELNPVTVSLHRKEFADFLGHLADDPRVDMINAEGRSFLRAGGAPFDLIWYVAPDSYASTNAATSGAFVLSESYLYTVEAILDSFARLSDDGIVAMQFGEAAYAQRPKRTVRYIATARVALLRLSVVAPERHILVATSPGFGPGAVATTVLVAKRPFDEPRATRFAEGVAAIDGGHLAHAWNAPPESSPVGQAVRLDREALGPWLAALPYEAGAVTDDSPFFWHFVRFRDVLRGRLSALHLEDGAGELLLLAFLGVATAFAAIFLLSPLLAIRSAWRTIPHKLDALVYFGALGIGFMLLEVSLIQRLTLFLGYPTYSLSVTLFAILVSSGAGSLLAQRWTRARNRALAGIGIALVALVVFDIVFLTRLLGALVGLGLAWRVAIAIALVAPIGLCLGGLLPIGLQSMAALTPHRTEIVAWCWSVNGFFSVLSSVLATVLAMILGFDAVMALALAVYLVGFAALLRVPVPSRA
jgi:hypothetical protein